MIIEKLIKYISLTTFLGSHTLLFIFIEKVIIGEKESDIKHKNLERVTKLYPSFVEYVLINH